MNKDQLRDQLKEQIENNFDWDVPEKVKDSMADFILALLAEQKKEHAIHLAAAESNHDQLKTFYEGKLIEQEKAMEKKLEKYFDGLIFISSPQDTLKNILSTLKEQ